MGRIPSMRIIFGWLLFPGDKSLFDGVVNPEAGSLEEVVRDDASDVEVAAVLGGRKCSAIGEVCGD